MAGKRNKVGELLESVGGGAGTRMRKQPVGPLGEPVNGGEMLLSILSRGSQENSRV